MKRVFANVGFSAALTLITLNFMNIKWAFVVFISAGALFVLFMCVGKTRRAITVPLCLFSVLLFSLIFIFNYYSSYLPQIKMSGQTVNAQLYITDLEEKTSSGKYSYTVKSKSIDLPESPQNIKFTLYSDRKINAEYYQVFDANVDLFSFADNAYESAGNFGNDIFLKGSLNSFMTTDKSVKSLNKYVLNIRNYLKNVFRERLPGDEGAVSLALLTGNKSLLSSEAYNNLKACGVTHLMAVSGLHMSIVAGFLYYLLRKITIPLYPRVFITLFSVLFYISLSGFSKSMIRSGIMMIVYLISLLAENKSDSLNSLGLAAFIVCFNPYAVADAGAMLTFTAVLGLITIEPKFKSAFHFENKVLNYFLDIILASAAVFISTFPVMYFIFGSVSIMGLIINLIMIPAAQVSLILSVIFAFFCSVPYISEILCRVLFIINRFMLLAVDKCSKASFSVLNINAPVLALIISAVFIIFAVGFLIGNRGIFKKCAVISAFLFVISCTVFSVVSDNYTYVRILGGENSNAFIVYDNKNAFVLGIDEYSQFYSAGNII
ncbi:MAG: ComEC/Rec2 family competence protein, partial [Clostridiales bacterium]|nr:ComEC/Rec2 family competence protein [Clostridiales bacterium]